MGRIQQFKREVRSSVGKVLAYQIRDGFGASLSGMLERVARGQPVGDSEIKEFFSHHAMEDDRDGGNGPQFVSYGMGPTLAPGSKPGRFTAVVPVTGVALYDLEWQPICFSTRLLASTMNQLAADPTIDTIVLIFDTPGGAVTGTSEAGDAIFAARKKKTVIGIVDPLCASAGYWLASQCTKIVAVPSADIGSVGVFMMHTDCSGFMQQNGIKPTFIFATDSPYKVEGNSYEPLSEDARNFYQAEVDVIMADFVAAIARGRDVKPDAVLAKFGKGRCMSATDAKKAGMIDEISTMSIALAKIGIANPVDVDVRRRRSEASDEAESGERPSAEADEPKSIIIDGNLIVDGSITGTMYLSEADLGEIVAAGVVLTGECKSIEFRTDNISGRPVCYALADWPIHTEIAADVIAANSGHLRSAGNQVTITVENGHAIYVKLGEWENGSWICGLLAGSKFEPPPKTQAETDAALAEAARLRLAIHRAS